MSQSPIISVQRHYFMRQVFRILGALVVLTIFAVSNPRAATASPIETTFDSIVVLRSANNKDRFLGSGIIWGDGALVVTNAHVVGDADTLRVVDAKGNIFLAEVIGRDPVRDVAVLTVPGLTGPSLPLGPFPSPGDEVWAIGAPLELDMTVTHGVVSARARQVEAAVPIRFLQHDAAVNPGSSGGALVDKEGRLIGMNSRIADGSRYYVGISYAISVADLARIATGLIDETLLPFPKLGLQLRPISREIAAALGIEPQGMLIDRAQPGELAEKAGLMAGDIILAAAGIPLAKAGDLAFAIEASLGSGFMVLKVMRGGQDMTIELLFLPPNTNALALRGMEGAAPLNRISSYRLEALGLILDDEARITTVSENSPALFAGIIHTDVILSINGKTMNASALRRLEITAPSLILLQRAGGATLHVILDPWDTGEGIRPMGGANVLDPAVVVF